ncbi:MAG TPA: hypothetical protein VK211_26380 [Kamptonema sp.]|nr:hypothetical protein [Kamptonema sp.]
MDINALELAKNRTGVFKKFLQTESDQKANSDKLAFLDCGIENSPYKKNIKNYPECLKQKPDGLKVVSYATTTDVSASNKSGKFTRYPNVGELPPINAQGLNFLHEDIKQACVCIGTFVDGKILGQWLGKNPVVKAQCWSTTKIMPILNAVCQVNARHPDCDIDNCSIIDADGQQDDVAFSDVLDDIVTYANRIASSNSLAAMFKRFENRTALEQWVKKITGNNDINFTRDYGEVAFLENPKVLDVIRQKVVLTAEPNSPQGDNLVSTYDLTRFISMLGWHFHIPQPSRFPGAQWHSLETVVKAMGKDSARYTDAAIATLGINNVISSLVIISKLGQGLSTTRQTIETVYTAFVQFVDERPKASSKPAKLRTFAMTLRGAKSLQDVDTDRAAVELDARMAAEVTEILRRVVAEEWP